MISTLEQLAKSDLTILITGETGTGKSELARKIHHLSPRRDKKFIAINLATLAENIVESELFGHERGAFSGAENRRVGKLEVANGGTVFLDEIGEIPLRLQAKLLEVLNSKIISPVGSNREIQLDIRIITATNRNLEQMVIDGEFRLDLLHRIRTIHKHLIPLREKPEEIAPLAKIFVREFCEKQGITPPFLDENFENEISRMSWEGNIRELKAAMEFAVISSQGKALNVSHLPAHSKKNVANSSAGAIHISFPTDFQTAKSQFEREYLKQILIRFGGKINFTAKKTGISKVTLIEKIRRYEIDIPEIKYSQHKNNQVYL